MPCGKRRSGCVLPVIENLQVNVEVADVADSRYCDKAQCSCTEVFYHQALEKNNKKNINTHKCNCCSNHFTFAQNN